MSDYITLISAVRPDWETPNPIGKHIDMVDGEPKASSNIKHSRFLAETIEIKSLKLDLMLILQNMKSNQAIILGYVESTEDGYPYRVISKGEFAEMAGTSRYLIRKVFYQGHDYVPRAKEFFQFSNVIMFDRDVRGEAASYEEWWTALSTVCAPLAGAERLVSGSSSCRVVDGDGNPVLNSKSSHTYIKINKPSEIVPFILALKARCWNGGQGFYVEDKNGKKNLKRTIFDESVYQTNRVVFESAPTSNDFAIAVPQLRHYPGKIVKVDEYSELSKEERAKYFELTKRTIFKDQSTVNGQPSDFETEETLELEAVIQTESGEMTIQEYTENAQLGQLRCQSPFREESTSWAAFINKDKQGNAFVFDMGGPIKYIRPAKSRLEPSPEETIFLYRKAFVEHNDKDYEEDFEEFDHYGWFMKIVDAAVIHEYPKSKYAYLVKQIKMNEELAPFAAIGNFRDAIKETKDESKGTESGKMTEEDLVEKCAEVYGTDNLISIPLGFYTWAGKGYWEIMLDKVLAQQILVRNTLKKYCSSQGVTIAKISSVHDHLAVRVRKSLDFNSESSVRRINVKNGTLHYARGEWQLRSHNKYDYDTNQIPYNYIKDQPIPLWDKFMESLFEGCEDPKENIKAIEQRIGYILTSSTYFELIWFLHGVPGCGKSTIAKLLVYMLGSSNVASVKLSDFYDKFSIERMSRALLIMVTEVDAQSTLPTSEMKASVSGDPISVAKKFQDYYETAFKATILIICNELPGNTDHSGAVEARTDIVHLGNTYRGTDKEDKELLSKLKSEVEGIMSHCVRRLGEAIDQGGLHTPISWEANMEEWRGDTNRELLFAESCIESDLNSKVRTIEVYDEYKRWMLLSGYKYVRNQRDFNRHLRLAMNWQKPEKTGAGGKTYWLGLKLIKEERRDNVHPLREAEIARERKTSIIRPLNGF